MGNEEFLRLCKVKVAEYTNSHMDKIDGKNRSQYSMCTWYGVVRHYRTVKHF